MWRQGRPDAGPGAVVCFGHLEPQRLVDQPWSQVNLHRLSQVQLQLRAASSQQNLECLAWLGGWWEPAEQRSNRGENLNQETEADKARREAFIFLIEQKIFESNLLDPPREIQT